MTAPAASAVQIPTDDVVVAADLVVPEGATGVIVFAHGSGSSRHSPRNRAVAEVMHERGLATLLMDLLTEAEDASPQRSRELAFDIDTLTLRYLGALTWVERQENTAGLRVGAFGASTGAAAALIAATARPEVVRAVVSRGGRPDLASRALADVRVPTLFIVGGEDHQVIGLNEEALERIPDGEKRLEIVPGATHLFEEPGALDQVADLAAGWFEQHLAV